MKRTPIVTAVLLAGCLVLAPAASAQNTFFQGRERGWYWYEDPPRPPPPPPREPAPPPAGAAAPGRRAELAAFERLQQDMKEAQQIALIDPSPANVQAVLELNARAIRMASRFTEVAERVKWRTPGIDPVFDGVRPANLTAADTFDRVQRDERDATVRALAATHGLMFFFRGDCPYCHAYAPLLRRFAQQYGFTVLAVSMDGGALSEFPHARRDNGMLGRILAELGIPAEQFQVPFTVLVEPARRDVIAVGFGVLNPEEIAARIHRTVQAMRAEQAEASGPPARTAAAPAALAATSIAPLPARRTP